MHITWQNHKLGLTLTWHWMKDYRFLLCKLPIIIQITFVSSMHYLMSSLALISGININSYFYLWYVMYQNKIGLGACGPMLCQGYTRVAPTPKIILFILNDILILFWPLSENLEDGNYYNPNFIKNHWKYLNKLNHWKLHREKYKFKYNIIRNTSISL